MRPAPLLIARENFTDSLEVCLKLLAGKPEPDVTLIAEISLRYHLLAIAVLLSELDQQRFATLLALSGQAEAYLRTLDLSGAPRIGIYSRGIPFWDSLAAGDLDTARQIARHCPPAHLEGWEYEDDFLVAQFQCRLLLAPDDGAALQDILDRWEILLNGQRSPELDAARALLARDEAALDAALVEIARAREEKLDLWRQSPEFDDEVHATEGQISSYMLATLRLAELRGMASNDEYAFAPSVARVPPGTPLPAPESWRDPSSALALL